jgi:DNA-binding NarL/FixJ family response regulator
MEAGAAGYMLKGAVSTEVIDAVRMVRAGRRYLSPGVTGLVSKDHLVPDLSQPIEDPLTSLSSREREVLQLVVEGHTSADIARRLSLSPKTVETYRYRIMRKLNIDDLASLVKFAIQSGLTPLE